MSDEQRSGDGDPAQQASGERKWVASLKADIDVAFERQNVIVQIGDPLLYTLHVSSYHSESTKPRKTSQNAYQTDLLISEQFTGSTDWVPRVVVEFKLGTVTTHDALTYSAKAAMHKNVHPYLRYGIVIGKHPKPVPRRLI
jgi:hypothetical protein